MLEGMGLWVATLLLGQFSMMGGDPRREFAAGDKDAVLLFPPETVCGAVAGEMVWTADSSALVVVRTSATIGPDDVMGFMGGARPSEADVARLQPRIELLTWSTKTKKVRSIASADASHLMVSGIQPLSGSDRVVLGLTEVATGPSGEPLATHSVALLSAATGTLTRLSSVGQKELMESFSVSPTRPLGFIHRVDRTQGFDTVRFFGADGRLGNPLKLAAGSNVDFDDKGLPSLMTIERQRGAKPRARITRIDPTVPRLLDTVDFVPPKEAKAPTKEAEKPLGVQLITGTVSGASAPSIFLKVAGGKPEEMGVVTTDGTRGLLSPKGDAIAYVSQGSAMVRLMAKVPRSAYDQARMAAERTAAMSNAKQAALALIMFANDTDDTYPSQDVDLRGKLGPYLKDPSLLDKFTYTFAGGSANSIDRPAETQIGYVSGPGGRAVAYADGHVKWIPDAP